jgi:hypothetical protein
MKMWNNVVLPLGRHRTGLGHETHQWIDIALGFVLSLYAGDLASP